MFDTAEDADSGATVPATGSGQVDAAVFTGWAQALAGVDRSAHDEARIDQIRALEDLKSAVAAAHAKLTADFDAGQRRTHAELGVPADQQGRGVANQVALARRESPHRGNQHLGLANVLVREMPHTLAALESGHLNEWRATLMVRETACLTREDRQTIDRAIAADTDTLDELGDGQLVSQIRKLAYRLDPHSVVDRGRRAEKERRVTTRPAPDTMAYLTALLPVAQAVAVHAALIRAADTVAATGDPRNRSQIMADTLVQRVTGRAEAVGVPVQVHLVMTLETLFGSNEPAHLDGHGPIPGGLARDILANATAADQAWLRRLFTRPDTGELVAMDSHSRCFPEGIARLIRIRDQVCRTPWCDAPIRHADHVVGHARGGATSSKNGQGLCEQCNYAKQAPGWRARPRPGPRHTVETTTPTGHRYRSTAPPLPGAPISRPPRPSRLEARFTDLVLAS